MMREIDVKELQKNPFSMIGEEWMLITAEKEGKINTMTASWGGVGVLWGKNVVTAYIRPQRYTKEFVDGSEIFTISVLGEEYRKALSYLGSRSGRDEDKIAAAGLHPISLEGAPSFEEAELVLVCRKCYHDRIRPENMLDAADDARWYPKKDYHEVYIGEIVKAYVK